MTPEIYHIPALLEDSINGLNIKPDGIYADVTFGGGGHSRAILGKLGDNGHLFGFDRDSDALKNAPDDPRFTFVHSNFRHITNFMRYHGVRSLDGILADLGVSFHHFDDARRGFSFRSDAPLDMRMNRNAELTAAVIAESYTASQLEGLFRAYTDLKRPRAVAESIIKARASEPIDTTFRLADAVRPVLNPKSEKKELAQVFQAFRIEVNGEMEALKRFLNATAKVICRRPHGKELHEDREYRRERGERFLRTHLLSMEADHPIPDCSFGRRNRAQPQVKIRKITYRRIDHTGKQKQIMAEKSKNKQKRGWMSELRYGRSLSIDFFKANAWLMLLFVVAILALIGLRYKTKTKMAEIKQLTVELQRAESHKLQEKSLYMSLIRESEMVKMVREKNLNLEFQEQPPFELTDDETK